MVYTTFTNCAFGTIDTPVGSPLIGSEALANFQLHHADPTVPTVFSTSSAEQWRSYRAVLAQAAAIWGNTAGRNLATFQAGPITLLPHGSYNESDGWLTFLDISLAGTLDDYYTYGSDAPAGDYGVLAFTYDGFAEGWQRISFADQRVFPHSRRANGFIWFLRDGVTATVITHVKTPGALQVGSPIIGDLSLETDVETALLSQLETFNFTEGVGGTDIHFAVTDTDGVLKRSTQAANANGPATIDGQYSSAYTFALINAYLSEAWQQTSAPDAGAAEEETILTSNGIYALHTGCAHSAKLSITGGDDNKSTFVGKPPFRYYGVVAFGWGAFMGPLQYLNSQFPLVRPAAPGANTLWFAIKPDVSVAALIETTPRALLSAQSGRGEINLVAGITTGIQP